jgi:hypothetical protein
MTNMENEISGPYKGVFLMKEDEHGLWHFFHYPDRKTLTREELGTLMKMSNNFWTLICYPHEQ